MPTSPQTGISSRRRGRPRFWNNCATILAAILPIVGAAVLGGCARPQPEIAPTRLRIAVLPDQPVECRADMVVTSFSDITARKRAEEAGRELSLFRKYSFLR